MAEAAAPPAPAPAANAAPANSPTRAAAPVPAPAQAPTPPASGRAPAPAKPDSAASNRSKTAQDKPVSKPATDLNNAYDQLDRIAAASQTPPPAEPSGDEAAAQTGDTPGDQPAPSASPNAEAPAKARTLRETLDFTKAELAKREARIKELEGAGAQPKDDPEKTKLSETLAQREKRLAELEDELRYTNYERTDEYKTRYLTPFLDAYEQGRNKVGSFKLVGEDGNERQGTAQDFDAFMRITDDNDAAEAAAAMFGNKSPMVMYHREQCLALNAARNKAIADYRQNGTAREAQRAEAATKHRAELAALWESEAKAAVENPKFKPWFKAAEGDTVGAELLEKGFQFADEAFGKPPRGPDGKFIQRSPQETAKMHAVVRNKAAAFDYQIHRNQLLQKENRELKKKLTDFESSVPGPGQGHGKTAAPQSSWSNIDAELARRADR